MKRSATSVLWELAAAILLAIGAVVLVAVYLPIINQSYFHSMTEEETRPLRDYVIGSALAVLIFGLSWYSNLKAMKLRGEI